MYQKLVVETTFDMVSIVEKTRWLTDDERQAWVRFAAVLELLPPALDAQLTRDENLTHFDYFTLAMLSEAPGKLLRMAVLAARTNATLPRLSRVATRLESLGYVERTPCPEDGRATNLILTKSGWEKVQQAAPGHVHNVRSLVIDALSPRQIAALDELSRSLLQRLDPDGKMAGALE